MRRHKALSVGQGNSMNINVAPKERGQLTLSVGQGISENNKISSKGATS